MHLAVDVDYREDGSAVAAAVAFADWTSGTISQTLLRHIRSVAPYRPGHFFERELPCILAVLADFSARPETIIIDGYCVLGSDRRNGLGAHLYRALGSGTPIVGVAKTRFRDTPSDTEVLRGGSARPLYVTGIGIDARTAKARVASMHGEHRVPTVLAAVDRACRDRGFPVTAAAR